MRSDEEEPVPCLSTKPGLEYRTCKRDVHSRSQVHMHRLGEASEEVLLSAVERNADTTVADGGLSRHTYPCPSCGLRFHQSKSLKAHMKTHNVPKGGDWATCVLESCSFQISSHKELLKHILDVHGVKAVECRYRVCGAVFQTEAEMLIHHQTHRAYHCSQCEFSCSNKAQFLRHQRSGHAGSDELCCDFCSFSTFNPVQSERHIKRCHPKEKAHRCFQCSYATSHQRSLKRHTLTHSGEKPHKCGLCDFRCRDESSLSRHMLTHSDNKNFMCSDCGYITKWKHYLTVHMRKHAGDLRYQCDQCTYRCHRADQLKSHKLRHQAKSLICEICAFACKRKYELRSHMTSKHSGDDRQPTVYRCTFCTYATCYRQALRNHENCQHTRLKEFHCALCSYVSFSTISLFLHKRKAHGYVPGDQRWLEKYAAKEKERSSKKETDGFYRRSLTAEQSKQTTQGARGPQGEQAEHPAAAEFRKQTETKNTKCDDTLGSEPQEGANESPSGSSDTLSANTMLLNDEGGTESHYDTLKEKENPASLTHFFEDKEEDDEDTGVDEESDLDSPESGSEVTPELVGTAFSPNTVPRFTSVDCQPMSSQKMTKNHDRDQTDASVLEVHVDETALSSHRQSGQNFGAQVKGKDVYLPNQCPKFSEKHQTEEKHCSEGNKGTEIPTAETNSSQTETSSKRQVTVELNNQELQQVEITWSSAETQHQQQEFVLTGKDRRFVCGLCSFTSLRPATFQRHVSACLKRVGQKDSQRPFAGDNSSKEGGAEEKVRTGMEWNGNVEHTVTVRREEREPVDVAQSNTVQKTSTAPHVEVKHRDCTKTFGSFTKRPPSLKRHSRSRSGRGPYKCGDCQYSTGNRQKMTRHVRTHTGEKPYGCRLCTYTCADPSRLKLHLRVHQEEKKYLCPDCGYRCKWSSQLKYHMTRHTGEKAFVCGECDYRTNRADALRAHKDTQHCDHRPYVCEKCGKAFKTKFILNTHQRQHSEGRLYSCGLCPKTFRWPAGLRHHFLSHTNQQPFSCAHCSYTARQKFQVVKHLRRRHPEVLVEEGVVKQMEATRLTLKEALQGALGDEENREKRVETRDVP